MSENTCGNFWEIANKSNFEGELHLEFEGIFGKSQRDIENSTWVCGDMEFLFMCSLWYISWVSIAKLRDIKLNTRRKIPYLQAAMHHFVYYINLLLTRKHRLDSRFKNGIMALLEQVRCQQLIGYLKHTRNWNYCNFSHILIRFFSVVEIPIKHSSHIIKGLFPIKVFTLNEFI